MMLRRDLVRVWTGIVVLSSIFLIGQDAEWCPQSVTISGKVFEIPLLEPIAGATVEIEGTSISSTSGEDGSWTLEDVPAGEDPLIKITAPGCPPSFNIFPLSLGIFEWDLCVMDQLFYFLFVWDAILSGADPDNLCLIFGSAFGFADTNYPQIIAPLPGVSVNVTPDTLSVTYLSEGGVPDPALTETSSLGLFYLVVPDASTIATVSLSGTKPSTDIIGPASYLTAPGAYVRAELMDFSVP